MTDKDKQIIKLISEGKTSKEIGDELFLTENTVQQYVVLIRKELSAKNIAHLVGIALRNKIIK